MCECVARDGRVGALRLRTRACLAGKWAARASPSRLRLRRALFTRSPAARAIDRGDGPAAPAPVRGRRGVFRGVRVRLESSVAFGGCAAARTGGIAGIRALVD